MSGFNDAMTLADARDTLRGTLADGHNCPCCGQLAKVYERRIHSTMARELVAAYQAGAANQFVNLNNVFAGTNLHKRGGDFAKLRYWSLVVEADTKRDDGGRAGWWKLTPAGAAFARNEIVVPRVAQVYDGKLLALVGDPVGITDCLGSRFDYNDLMTLPPIGEPIAFDLTDWHAAV